MHGLKQFPSSRTLIIIHRETLTPLVHGDDFVAVAVDGQLDHFEQVLVNSMEIKRVGRIGPCRSSTGKVLKCVSQLEWRWLHLEGGSQIDGKVAQHGEPAGRKD